MNDRKPRRVVPTVEVIRRPASGPGGVTPTPSPAPRPTPRPTASAPAPAPVEHASEAPAPAPRPVMPSPTPRPVGAAPAPRPGAPRPGGGGGPRGAFSRPRTPRPPPTVEEINALATREHVPARIAKGELEGKMKCRIWRKLHAEEAKRFDQVYELMGKNPGLVLGDAFGVLQSGLTVPEFMARKERTQRKVAIKQARAEVANEAVSGFLASLVASKAELSVVLGERTMLDTLVSEEPIAFTLERTGRLEKLQVVLVARRAEWEALLPSLQRDPKLAQKPASVARQPDKRPHSDPRPFLAHVDQPVRLVLRNGITLTAPLLKVGSFDLLLGEPEHELFVPLHAILRFEPTAPEAAADSESPASP
ncbi:hypothetical protein P2318_26845 [Myxococcaceae bacterium GXIMD 01537]